MCMRRMARSSVAVLALMLPALPPAVAAVPGGDAPPPDGVVTFFADDSVTGYQETCSGSTGWIRIRSRTAK